MMVKKQPILGHHHKPPPNPPQPSPPSSGNKATTSAFTRSFGVYFPRASAQVQPRPPDLTSTVSDLLRLVEDLRDREYRLKTELLEHKLLRESVAIVPLLESQIASKAGELQSVGKRIEKLVAENECLLHENELLKGKLEEERRERERTVGDLEAEVVNLRHKLRMKEIEAEEMVSSCSKTTMSSSHLSRNLSTRKTTTARSIEVSVSVSSTGSSSSHNVDDLMKGVTMDVVESKRAEQGGESESRPRDSCSSNCSEELPETSESAISAVRSRAPRVPKPPPMKRSSSSSSTTASDRKPADCATSIPPPPPPPFSFKAAAPPPPPPPPSRPVRSPAKAAGSQPPPPPPLPAKGMKAVQQPKVKRVPEVVEFYHSLMRRDSRRESGAGMAEATAANTRDLVGEIENRSAHLLAIKTDVETQGDLIRFLIKEVENAVFTEIEDVVAFVKWLDDELSYLVDERAVLKHFDWPEQKADALREAAFEYSDLKKLEYEASSFKDNTRQACAPALKKMQALLEKLEHGVYNLSRLRESAANRFKALLIPVDWMLENGFVSQIKLASVKLAMKYMKRVSAELDSICGGPEEEELIVQGVRFAFRVHQFAGGFDIETMRAFQELRDRANSCRLQCQNQQQQQKLVCRSMSC